MGRPLIVAFGHMLALLWKETIGNEAAAAERHLPRFRSDTHNDRPTKDTAHRPRISLNRPSRNTDRARVEQRIIHELPIGRKERTLKQAFTRGIDPWHAITGLCIMRAY